MKMFQTKTELRTSKYLETYLFQVMARGSDYTEASCQGVQVFLALQRAVFTGRRTNIPVMVTVHASYHPASMNQMYRMNSARGVSTAHFPAPLSQRSFPVGDAGKNHNLPWCIKNSASSDRWITVMLI